MMLVINLNSNKCKFYKYKRHSTDLSLQKEISYPENKLKTTEQAAGNLGRFKKKSTPQSSYSPANDIKEIHIDNFAKEIANHLDKARIDNGLEEFFIIATPKMTGLLNQHINKHVKEKIFKTIQKDLINLPDHELAEFLKENSQFPEE